MLTATTLREAARQYWRAAIEEPTLVIKSLLANHALALTFLAEKIEHDEAEHAP